MILYRRLNLLIAPEGIEIEIAVNSIDYSKILLIAPEGIEISLLPQFLSALSYS